MDTDRECANKAAAAYHQTSLLEIHRAPVRAHVERGPRAPEPPSRPAPCLSFLIRNEEGEAALDTLSKHRAPTLGLMLNKVRKVRGYQNTLQLISPSVESSLGLEGGTPASWSQTLNRASYPQAATASGKFFTSLGVNFQT